MLAVIDDEIGRRLCAVKGIGQRDERDGLDGRDAGIDRDMQIDRAEIAVCRYLCGDLAIRYFSAGCEGFADGWRGNGERCGNAALIRQKSAERADDAVFLRSDDDARTRDRDGARGGGDLHDEISEIFAVL